MITTTPDVQQIKFFVDCDFISNISFGDEDLEDIFSVVIVEVSGKAIVRVSLEKYEGIYRNYAFVDMLNVDASIRRQGYGRRIMNMVDKIALHALHVDRISLWVRVDSWMKEWYQRLGFVLDSETINEESGYAMMKKQTSPTKA